jgi:hypothetical protein
VANQTAYGFVSLQYAFSETVQTVGVDVIRGAINESARVYNDQLSRLMSGWVERSTTWQERVELPGSGTLQPLDEWGNPLPVRPAGHYDVGYPIQGGGTAWGTNRVSAALLTVEQANRYTLDSLQRDTDWMRRHLLGSLFTNTSWVYADKQHGNLTVQPLANGDATIYLRQGAIGSATDSHYLAQANAIDNTNNPYNTLYNELEEHPSNTGPFVAYIPTNLREATEALTSFVEIGDNDIQPSINEASLTNNGSAAIRGPGHQIIGKIQNKMWVVEMRSLPDNYIVAVAAGAGPFVRMREYPASALQGFFPEFHSPDGNLIENRFIRYAGFGVRNRVAAAVMRVGNASYAIPTGYQSPLAQ